MEKSENQAKYVDEFKLFIDSIELNEKFDVFIDKFKIHRYFKNCAETIEQLKEDKNYGKQGLKLFIFSWFTRDRESCAAIIQLLEDSDLKEQAQKLMEFNKSSGPMKLVNDVELSVATRPNPSKNLSGAITLLKSGRGKCVIINNVEDPQFPPFDNYGQIITPVGLKRETQRFKHIFEELHFDVIVLTKLNANKMKEELTRISKKEVGQEDEAFVLIVISHGQDEAIFGWNACEANREINFKEIRADDQKAQQTIRDDQVNIKELNEIFSEKNCKILQSKPKLHFYICCRVKSGNKQGSNDMQKVQFNVIKPEPKRYSDTFVSYACAKGYEAYYNIFTGFSYFGQAFTHSIAQYACDYPLSEIMTRTSKRLENMYSDENGRPEEAGSYGIQVNTYSMSNQLFFNPGHKE